MHIVIEDIAWETRPELIIIMHCWKTTFMNSYACRIVLYTERAIKEHLSP
jgi:hypothetical protein